MNTSQYTPIFTNTSNAFAHKSMGVRLPSIIQQTLQRNPDYSPLIRDNLQRLHDDLQSNASIAQVSSAAPDADMWAKYGAMLGGTPWLDTWWFFAEHTVYRMMIEAVRWWETEKDPFLSFKQDELYSDRLKMLVESVTALNLDPEAQLSAMLERALWGNRADLSHDSLSQRIDHAEDDDLLVDDRAAVIRQLMNAGGTVHLVPDNAGSELTMDLLLVDTLLQQGIPVMIHPKMHPTFVSDATVSDVWQHIAMFDTGKWGNAAKQVAKRLYTAFDERRLQIFPDFYWNSPLFLYDLPLRIKRTFADARLVIFKGDANYRRLINDTIFPPETDFGIITGHFSAPLLAIRTIKSDPIAGLASHISPQLDAINPEWRVIGQYGMIQFKI